MVFPLILVEQLLLVLLMIISCRSFFPLRRSGVFTAPIFLTASLIMSLCRWFLPGIWGLILAAAAGYASSLMMFQGSWKKKLLFGVGILVVYTLMFLAAGWIMESNRIGLSLPYYLFSFLRQLFCQLLYYIVLFLAGIIYHKRRYAISYYLALLPILFSMIPVFLWDEYSSISFLEPAMPLVFLLLLIFDFGCLALESWMIMNLNTRTHLRIDQLERESLRSKYEILEDQYESSFSFLHQLLSQCSSLNRDIETKDRALISAQVADIARLAFDKFNDVAISTPVLNRQLELEHERITAANVMVSAMIRNDFFALLTFDEQKLLFSSVLDFVLSICEKAQSPARIIAIKSAKVLSDIMLVWIFSADSDPAGSEAFLNLQKKLSKAFQAGTKISWDEKRKQASLTVLLPAAMPQHLKPKSVGSDSN